MVLSKSAYARHRGVTPAMVTHWTNAGRLVIVDGKVDVEKSDASLSATLAPDRGGKGGKSSGAQQAVSELPFDDESYTRIRTRREGFRAKTEEVEYRAKIGEVIETVRYDMALADGLGPILSALDSLSARLGPTLAAESDVRKIQNLIDDAITAIRAEIADTLHRMIDGAAGTRQ